MIESPPHTSPHLLLALGNELLGDDGAGPLAANALVEEFGKAVDIVQSAEAGLALMEFLEGYKRALLLDAIVTCKHPPGTILEFNPADFQRVLAPSPHYAGIPEVFALAAQLGLDFPSEVRILAIEVENPYDFQEKLTPSVEAAMPAYIQAARAILDSWRSKE